MPVNGRDGNFTSRYFPGCLRCYIAPMLGHKTTFLPKSSKSNEGTIQPLVETCRQSSQDATARTN